MTKGATAAAFDKGAASALQSIESRLAALL
jgi:hypothetical protein